MKTAKKDKQLTIRLELDVIKELQKLADKDQRKLADYIRIKLKAIITSEKGN